MWLVCDVFNKSSFFSLSLLPLVCMVHTSKLNVKAPRLDNRFHWCGHVGCSSGYCLDSYKSIDIRGINSQVNEQANSGLQWIKGQLAYMKQSNFIFVIIVFIYC